MRIDCLPPAPEPGSLPAALLAGCERFPWRPTPQGVLQAASAVLEVPVPREEVVSILSSYNLDLGNRHAEELCRQLADPRSLVVVAGQQPGVFGGPLLLCAKVATAVRVAQDLAARWDGPVVPLFWNHSEDHDVDEAARYFDFHQGSVRRRRAPLGKQGLSLDHLTVSRELAEFGSSALSDAGLRGDCRSLLPREAERFPLWTARVLSRYLNTSKFLQAEPFLFRSQLVPLVLKTVDQVGRAGAALRAGVEAVRRLGYEPQVRVEDDSPLFLVAPDGRRLRLVHRAQWSLRRADRFGAGAMESPSGRWLADLARTQPRAFSSNVLLRPVAQQTLLPVVAQICGPAETAYFAQLPEIFAWAERPLPAVVPRAQVTLLRPREEAARERLGVAPNALLEGARAWPDPAADLKRSAGAVEEEAAVIEDARELARLRHHLAEWVRPRGRPQERVLGPLALLGGHSPALLQRALERLDPWRFEQHVITFEEADEDEH